MLASRLLSILLLLQTRGRMSAPELADEFEVSVRTIYRDIDQLSAAGIPVFGERGRSGGFQLLDGYRTKLTGLTQSEAETLFLAGLPGPAAELGLADLLATARLKLLAALPSGVQAERIAARFHLDPKGWFSTSSPAEHLPDIARAVWNARVLEIHYRRANEAEAEARRVRPLGLVLKAGTWYLVAQRGKLLRTYRASNIACAEMLDETFVRPKDFDLVAYWTKSSREYEAASYRENAVVRLSPRGRGTLDLLGPYVVASAAKTAGPPDKDGWVRCTIPLESVGYGVRELLRLGDDVEVLEPAPLRAELKKRLEDIARLYRKRR